MQLSPRLAQPPVPTPDGASPFLSILTTLRGERPPANEAAAAAPAPAPAGPPASPSTAAAAAAVADAQPTLGARLLGGVAEHQNAYLANQQMLAVVSAGLGARISTIAKGAWAMLRGTEPQETAPTEHASA